MTRLNAWVVSRALVGVTAAETKDVKAAIVATDPVNVRLHPEANARFLLERTSKRGVIHPNYGFLE